MELDINHIDKELNNIIDNKKVYNNKIILHALAMIELITITKETNLITYKFIEYLNYLKCYIKCYIDFDFLFYVCNHKEKVIIKDNFINDFDENSSTLSLSSNEDLDHRINKMLRDDSCLLNEIIQDDEFLKYEEFDKKILKLSKRLFNLIDVDRDGYISALDALHILKITKKYPLLFENNFDDMIVSLLTSKNKITFDVFLKYLL